MKRILVIEDNPQNLYMFRFLLEGQGHEVIEALDGQEGIDLARQNHPDLILVDIQLPKMDGLEVTRRLKGNPTTSAIPIVAVTTLGVPDESTRPMQAGCLGCIEKPIDPKTFVCQIDQFL